MSAPSRKSGRSPSLSATWRRCNSLTPIFPSPSASAPPLFTACCRFLLMGAKMRSFSRVISRHPPPPPAPAHAPRDHRGPHGRQRRQVRRLHGKDYQGQGVLFFHFGAADILHFLQKATCFLWYCGARCAQICSVCKIVLCFFFGGSTLGGFYYQDCYKSGWT